MFSESYPKNGVKFGLETLPPMSGTASERTAPDEPKPRDMAPAPAAAPEPAGSFFHGLVIWLAILLPVWVLVIWKLFSWL